MASNSRISKLSTHVKEYFSGLKRRKHHSSSSISDGTISSQHHQHQGELEIVHLSMEESKYFPAQQVKAGFVEVPMNYWLTQSDDEEEDVMTAGSLPSFSKTVADANSRESDAYVPLRIPTQKALPIAGRRKDKEMRFSQDEWQEKAGEALFGSLRSRNKMAGIKQQTVGSKRGREQTEGEAARQSGDVYDDTVVTFNGWTERGNAVKGSAKSPRITSSFSTNGPPVQRLHVDQMQSSFLSLSSAESSPTHASPHDQCTNALNELLFATNARVEAELHGLPQCYIDGRDATSKFASDFNTIVSHAYDDFVPAARSVLATVSQMTRSAEHVGPMETLVAEIVARYADETSNSHRHYDDYAIYSSSDLQQAMDAMGVSFVKYSKEQMAGYAATSISKYVTSQVLLSTGIENDLQDKLESSTQALDVTAGQIDVLESLRGADDGRNVEEDLRRLRSRADGWETRICQLQADVADASHIRKTFELVLIQVQAL